MLSKMDPDTNDSHFLEHFGADQLQEALSHWNNNTINQQQLGNAGEAQSFDLNAEIKRLQQYQQAQPQGSSGLLPGTQQFGSETGLLQSMYNSMDAKNAQQPQTYTVSVNNPTQLLQSGMMGADPRFLLAQQSSPNLQYQMAFQQQESSPLPSPHSLFHRDGSRRMRGGVIEPFPEKLHRLLVECEQAGRGDVISFVANGRAFSIHKPDKFFKEIVPLYFRQSRLSSFKRQLNLYGFELINTGPARGGYYHENFVKDKPELCRKMRRVAIKVGPKDGKKKDDKNKDNHEEEEDEDQ